jgi:hypothetical protein
MEFIPGQVSFLKFKIFRKSYQELVFRQIANEQHNEFILNSYAEIRTSAIGNT